MQGAPGNADNWKNEHETLMYALAGVVPLLGGRAPATYVYSDAGHAPRSVAFQVRRIDEHFAKLPTLADDGMMEPQRRLVVSLRADLEAEDARRVDGRRILLIEQRLMALANAISERYFSHASDPSPADRRSKLA